MKHHHLALILVALACGGEKVSWETQESARKQAIENAQISANAFRNAQYPDLAISMRGDSSINGDCPQGDGWATIDLVEKGTGTKKVALKCSTVSDSIGCLTESDFKARPQYANQDGHCNSDLPFPLPKIQK